MSSMDTLSVNRRLFTTEAPKVTGLSPNEGPPGTKMTIRGENLGTSQKDLIGLEICGVNCLMYADWKSSSKITTRSGRCKGIGDVIVTTRSGGRGTCTVQFKGYEDIISPTKDSAVWINEDEYFVFTNARHRSVSSPSLYPQDPLGLCPDEDSPTSVRGKLSDSLFKELFPEHTEKDCGNMLSKNFVPAWYLLENHSRVGFKDLKKGLQCLKQKLNEKSPTSSFGPLTLLKPNVLAVIECLDALKAVNLALKKDKQDVGSDLTSKIEDGITKAMEEAHEVYDSVLLKKDLADSTRNALNVLQRYRFLFNLPSSIERNINKGDYDIVINDYQRAKSLFSDTQVKVFQKVYNEVEQRIFKFSAMLRQKLKAVCDSDEGRNIEELKKLVKYLINLEVKGNPGWESVLAIKDNLTRSLKKCWETHLSAMKSVNPVVIESDSLGEDDDGPVIEAPQPVLFLEEITSIFTQNYADVVKLGNSYLNGDLYVKETEEQLAKKEKFMSEEVVHKSIELVINLIRSALLPHSVKNISDIEPWPKAPSETFVIWLPRCLRLLTAFYDTLRKQELSQSADQIVQLLISDLKLHTLECLFHEAAEEVKQLSGKENWDMQLDDAIGTRTQLPLLFESKVMEILQLIRETILQCSLPGETDIFSKINVQGQLKQMSQTLLQAFVFALEQTLSNTVTSPTTVLKNNPSSEHKMLIIVCNSTFTTNQVLPRIQDGFEKYSYPNMSAVIKNVQNKYKDLENKLLQQYISQKCAPIIEGIESCIYLIDKDCFVNGEKPTDVSFYTKEALMNIIEVQAEVFSIAPPLVRKIMVTVIDNAAEEIARLYAYLSDQMTDAKNLQATLDLASLQHVFDNPENYKSIKAEKMFNSCHVYLRDIHDPKDVQLINYLFNQYKTIMALQLACFKWKSEQTLITI